MTEQIPPLEISNEELEANTNKEVALDHQEQYKIPKLKIDDKTKKEIANLEAELKFRESPVNNQIKEAVAKKDTGGEKEKFEAQVVDIRKNQGSAWRKLKTAMQFTLAGIFGTTLANSLKAESGNLNDSTKNKIEKVSSIKSDSLETEYTGNEAVDDVVRQDWNNYLDYLDSIHMRAKPELNKGGLGYKLFDEYVKTHKTSLNREKLNAVRVEFLKLRAFMIKEHREGKIGWDKGVTEENFLGSVMRNEFSGDKAYPGLELTGKRFPKKKLNVLDQTQIDYNKVAFKAVNSGNLKGKISNVMSKDTKLIKVENEGFVKAPDRNPIASSDYVKNDTKKANRK